GRRPGSKNKRTLLREARETTYDNGEAGMWLALTESAKGGEMQAVSMIAARLTPPLKATDAPIELPGLEGSLTQKAEKIVEHMGRGEISPSEATGMINAIAGLCRVQEIDDLAKRLEAIERALKER